MRIGIDCRYILNPEYAEHAGVGHYVYYLIKHLLDIDQQNQYFLFFYDKRIEIPEFASKDNVKIIYLPKMNYINKIPFIYPHIVIPHVLRLYRLDLYHGPANVTPLFYLHKTILTIHDLSMYINPQWSNKEKFFYKKCLMPASIKKAKKILAVSENTKSDLENIFKVKSDKVIITHEGVEDYNNYQIKQEKVNNKFKFNCPYFLFISTIEPRKNLIRLFEAFKLFLDQTNNKNYKLILAGKKGWKYEKIFNKIKELNLEDNIIYLGYVSLEEKIFLLKNAYAFIYPSLYEGFGLPILEAMNMGVPIISSNISSIPELIIDNALLIDPYSVNSIKEAMIKITADNDMKQEFITKGRGIAKNFTWQQTAKQTLEVYKSLK